MIYNLDPKQQPVRKAARAFAEKEIAPVSDLWDRMPEPRQFPHDLYRQLGEQGFLGYPLPKTYGGQGKSILEYATLMEEISRVDVAFGLILGIPRLVIWPIVEFGSEQLKRDYAKACLTGEKVCAFALTEPDAGSDANNLKTTAVGDGDDFVINGEKVFITHGDAAHYVLLFCRIEGHKRVSAILVNTDQPGWQPRLLKNKLGVRAATTAYVKLDNVRVPRDHLVGEIDKGFRYAMMTLDGARINVAAQGLGLAQRALDESVAYSKKRIAFGAPIAKLQAIQGMIADMSTRIEAARLLTYKAAQMADRSEPYSIPAAQAKLFSSETANFCVDRAMQIHGGYGYIGEFSVIEKLYRDQRFLEIGEGTSEIQRLVIAGAVIGR